MKPLAKIVFAAYLIMLVWLVLFKFSYEPFTVIREFQTRSLNLIPFARTHNSEMIANIVAFIPFGVMLGVTFKQVAFMKKVAAIFAFSLAVEIIQYAFAIGVSDITDVIMNTLGGFVGAAAYGVVSKHVKEKNLDLTIVVVGTLTLLTILYLRFFVFIVKY